jgi:RNA polymerase sigma factor (sigma-70 family)
MSNRLSVEDVIQHVELCLHEKLESGEQIYSLIPWARVVSERYISAQRKKLRNFEPSEPDKIEHMANRQSNHNLPFDEKEELHEKINQLKPENKKILDLSFFKGYSGKEIAEFLSKEYGTIVRVDAVRKKKERAMDELRKKYL